MRLKIRHETAYTFETPPASVIQTLRVTPRSFDGQHVVRWRLDIDRNCRLHASEDAFGNQTHVFAVDGPVESLTVLVEGEIDTQDVSGVVRGAAERFPPALYLRETDLTTADLDIRAFAAEATAGAKDPLDALHLLLAAVHETVALDLEAKEPAGSAAEAFGVKRGTPQDLAHVFLAAARSIGAPGRYVTGYLHVDAAPEALNQTQDGQTQSLAATLDDEDRPRPDNPAHCWAEAHAPGFGWIGFDPSLGYCPMEAHVRVAIGLDHLGAAPTRGSRYGGFGETFSVNVHVEDSGARRAFRRA